MREPPAFDPRSERFRDDPRSLYRELHAGRPVISVPSANTWFVASHDLCLQVLTDARFSARQGQELRVRDDRLPASMLTTDPPEHDRLRHAASECFSPASMARAEAWIPGEVGDAVDAFVAALDGGSTIDAVEEFADPLAARILGRFLGLPAWEHPALSEWGQRLSVHLDPFAVPDPSLADAREEMLLRFADLMYEPEDPLGALALLAKSHSAGLATAHELLETAALLVIGGLEPLSSLIADTLAVRIGSGDLDGTVRVRTVVDEILRYDSPIPFTARRATSDVQLGDHLIPAGENVVVLLGAANHDPARFAEPDELDPSRRANPHLAFGAGRHVCLGAPLVRLAGDALVRRFGRSFPDLEIVDAATRRRDSTVPHAYATLGVRSREG